MVNLVRFAGELVDGGVWEGSGLVFLIVLTEVLEFVLVNIARGALEGSAAVSLEMVPRGGL
jgi:hypothetical protein